MTVAEISSNAIAACALVVSLWVASSEWRAPRSAYRQNAKAWRDFQRDGFLVIFNLDRREWECGIAEGHPRLSNDRLDRAVDRAHARWKRTGKVRAMSKDGMFFETIEPYP